MNITDLSVDYKKQITSEIEKFFQLKKEAFKQRGLSETLLSQIEDAVLNGKMLRGLLILLFANDQKIGDPYTKAAAAIELFHTGLLIQDDIMDNDTVRRGKDTFFVSVAKEGKKKKIVESMDYGKSIAMCAGDLAYFLSLELLSQMDCDSQTKLRIQQSFFEEMQYVASAQVADYTYGVSAYEPTVDEIFAVYRYKTARYTFSLPFEIGGKIHGYDEETTKKLSDIGEKMGILFQIKDDELGIFGDELKLGKTVGSDIRENKKTIYRYFLLQKCNATERKELLRVFGSSSVTEKEIEIVRQLMMKYHVFEEVNKLIDSMQKEVEDELSTLSLANEIKNNIQRVFRYVLCRDK